MVFTSISPSSSRSTARMAAPDSFHAAACRSVVGKAACPPLPQPSFLPWASTVLLLTANRRARVR